MNWIQRRMFDYLIKKFGAYTLAFEVVSRVHSQQWQGLIEGFVRAFMPGKHIQRSYRGKK